MQTPHSRDTWEISICKINSTIVLDIIQKEETPNDDQEKFSRWGYKFEQYCTETDPKQTFNPNDEFCTINRLNIGNHSIILACEIDCRTSVIIPSQKRKEPGTDQAEATRVDWHYVELKTYRLLADEKANYTFHKFKLLSFWIQSILPNVPEIVVGHRDDNGLVKELQSLKTVDIPNKANSYLASINRPSWDPTLCWRFVDQVLNLLKDTIQPKKTYLLSFANNNLTLNENTKKGVQEIVSLEFQTLFYPPVAKQESPNKQVVK